MSRHGYCDYYDEDDAALLAGHWKAVIRSATRGRRGQRFFRELLTALDAMSVKELVEGDLEDEEGSHCALGALGAAKGLPVSELDTYDSELLGEQFNIAHQLAQEVMYRNDETPELWRHAKPTPAERWASVREWTARQIVCTPDELLPLESEQ